MIFILLIIAILAFCIGLLDANPNPYKKNGMQNQCISSLNSIKGAKMLSEWLDSRKWICDFRRGKRPVSVEHEEGWNVTAEQKWVDFPGITDVEKVYKGNGLTSFLRLAHLLGCVVILRQLGMTDEEDEGSEQLVSRMRDKFYYRKLF